MSISGTFTLLITGHIPDKRAQKDEGRREKSNLEGLPERNRGR